jgi:HAD superfamily hydrolase (TIGR01459 family)
MTTRLDVRTGIRELIDEFDGLILDQWGVLHDGTTPYPGVIEALRNLVGRRVSVAVLTNSSKSETANRERLAGLGIPGILYGPLVSTADLLKAHLLQLAPRPRIFLLASDVDARLFEDRSLAVVARIEEAECVVLLTVPQNDADNPSSAPWIEAALARGLTLHTPSADVQSVIRGGKVVSGFSRIMNYYAAQGGQVLLHGKPSAHCYQACRDRLGLGPNARVAAVGDQFATDVVGAAQNSIYPILVATGAAATDRERYSEEVWHGNLMSRCREAGVTELTILPELRW